MKQQLQIKLYVFTISAMMFSASVNAQIVYTDVNPDSTSTGTYNLDLNNDGTTDFVISHSTAPANCGGPAGGPPPIWNFIRVSPKGTNQVVDSAGTDAKKMVLNANINSSILSWNNSVDLLMARQANSQFCRPGGQWRNAVDGYLGLKLISGGNTYYGWARLNTSGASSFTIKDYAYNTIPDQPILAGQISTTKTCQGGTTSISSNITGAAYQWQVDTGSGYADVIDNATYSGASTATLQIDNAPTDFYGYQYRCNVNGDLSTVTTLKFVNYWTGAVSSLWDNPANWSCGVLPDGNTDVVIDTGTAMLNVNGICRSITVSKGANFTANTGFDLQVTH